MKIVCLGDSLTYGYMLPRKKAWPNLLSEITTYRVVNKGVNGDTTAGMLSRFQTDVVAEKPSKLIIMGGTNDFSNGLDYIAAASNIKAMIMQCKYYIIKPMVLIPVPIISMEPMLLMKAGMVNAQIEKLKDELLEFQSIEGFELIDLKDEMIRTIQNENIADYYLDDLHLNFEGNKMVSEIISNYL